VLVNIQGSLCAAFLPPAMLDKSALDPFQTDAENTSVRASMIIIRRRCGVDVLLMLLYKGPD